MFPRGRYVDTARILVPAKGSLLAQWRALRRLRGCSALPVNHEPVCVRAGGDIRMSVIQGNIPAENVDNLRKNASVPNEIQDGGLQTE